MVTIKKTLQLSTLEGGERERGDRQRWGRVDDCHKIAHILTMFPLRQFCFPLCTFLYFASSLQ